MTNENISFTVFKGSKEGKIQQSTTKHEKLVGDEVLVAVTHSGLCGTDLHYKTTDMALGHEGAGLVKATGPGVRHLKPGDRVGWGYVHDTCGECEQCLTGHETFCPQRKMYGLADLEQGSFATGAVWREAFLFRIPDGLSSEDAAPLMCGGATVFNALEQAVDPTSRVGVVGVGGLGHLAIQFAAKMGTDVVVFSGHDTKKDEATELGAKSFYATADKDKLEIGRPIEILLVTTSAPPDWNLFIPILAPGAKIFPLSVSGGELSIPYQPFLVNGLTLQGSIVAPRWIHRRMLEFAALHKIKPMINTFKLDKDGIEEAIKTLEDGKMRYRGVLVQPESSML